MLLPAQDPYDREVVFEEAECCARRHGSVGLQVGRKEMRISLSHTDASVPCGECRHPVGLMNFIVDHHRVCAHCAKRYLGCRDQ